MWSCGDEIDAQKAEGRLGIGLGVGLETFLSLLAGPFYTALMYIQ